MAALKTENEVYLKNLIEQNRRSKTIIRGEKEAMKYRKRILSLRRGFKNYKCWSCQTVKARIVSKPTERCPVAHRFCDLCYNSDSARPREIPKQNWRCEHCDLTTTADNADHRRYRRAVLQWSTLLAVCRHCPGVLVPLSEMRGNKDNFAHLHAKELHHCNINRIGFTLSDLFETYTVRLPGKFQTPIEAEAEEKKNKPDQNIQSKRKKTVQ